MNEELHPSSVQPENHEQREANYNQQVTRNKQFTNNNKKKEEILKVEENNG